MQEKSLNSSHLLGYQVFSGRAGELLKFCEETLTHKVGISHIVTPNPEQLVLAWKDRKFKSALLAAEVRLPDGFGLIWASKVLSLSGKAQVLKNRVSGREVVVPLIEIAQKNHQNILIVGGKNYHRRVVQGKSYQVIEVTKQSLKNFSDVVGTEHTEFSTLWWTPGYSDVFNPSESEEFELQEVIKKIRPSVVFVAFGAPSQEYWGVTHKEFLESVGVRIVMSVGGSFDVLLGLVPTVPSWMAKNGFEWLFRLVSQPWRWRRQLNLIVFGWLVLKELTKKAS